MKKLLLLFLSLPLLIIAQSKNTSTSNLPIAIIDGNKNPGDVPDDVAFRLYFGALTVNVAAAPSLAASSTTPHSTTPRLPPGWDPSNATANMPFVERVKAAKMNLSVADALVFHSIVQFYAVQLASNTAPPLAGTITMGMAQQSLTPDGWKKLQSAITANKSNIKGRKLGTPSVAKLKAALASRTTMHPQEQQQCDPGDVWSSWSQDTDTGTAWVSGYLEGDGGLGGCTVYFDSGSGLSGPDGSNDCSDDNSGLSNYPNYAGCGTSVGIWDGGEVDGWGQFDVTDSYGNDLYSVSYTGISIVSLHAYGPSAGSIQNPLGIGYLTKYGAACQGYCTNPPYVEIVAFPSESCSYGLNGGYVQCGSVVDPFFGSCGAALCGCTGNPRCN